MVKINSEGYSPKNFTSTNMDVTQNDYSSMNIKFHFICKF